jgi:thioredoxin 1
MSKPILVVIGAVALFGGAALLFIMSGLSGERENPASRTQVQGNTKIAETGPYQTYASEKVAFASEGSVLLYFHATWCPTCKALESEILKDPSRIPQNVRILKLDYDTELELRQKYGVTTQHTFVQVDEEGNALQKFNDAFNLQDALSRIN